ncbi:hypothetical protein ACO22_00280 [Paracoccidioides brasiliensis]|uniref:Uncharacterized protein n=1 Tax=Paracoccidioides brasiliensis TaxID=121759 RepID=A0A1D2JPP6_PARBR|nr:hypothetical protein ACO22_00280 [Paracoccidioides brasiliensis]
MHVDQRKEGGGKSKSKEVGLGVSIDDYGGRSIGRIFPRAVKKSAPENKVSNYFTVIQISYEDLPLSEDGGHCRRSLMVCGVLFAIKWLNIPGGGCARSAAMVEQQWLAGDYRSKTRKLERHNESHLSMKV